MMMLCIENSEKSIRNLLELINKFSQIVDDKINTQKSVVSAQQQ